MKTTRNSGVNASQLTERFLVSFNQIDAELRNRTHRKRGNHDFTEVLLEFQQISSFPDLEIIRKAAMLRNVIVHEKKQAFQELATPAEFIVHRLEQIARQLQAPEPVEKRFVRPGILVLTPTMSLKETLDLVAAKGYSQFPVVDGAKIVGLLTENGIARWLSVMVSRESMIEFADATVASVLEHEEKRENLVVIPRLHLIDVIRRTFSEKKLLEAAVVTQTGRWDQAPLGIITRWDLSAP